MASVREKDRNEDVFIGVRFPLDHSQEGFFYKTKTIWSKSFRPSNSNQDLIGSGFDTSN